MPKRDVVRKIYLQKSMGSGGTSVVVGGTISVHALDSTYHYGTLADTQAPQFLKTDGTRPLAGNLSVLAGVTIDGVDLSAHAANPAAHHNPVTGTAPIAVAAGQVISLTLRAANPGLIIDAGLALGTPTSVSATSSSEVSGTGHTHAVLAYSDAVSTPSHLLKSTAEGDITLRELTANVINAPNVLRIEPSGGRVDFLDGTTLRNENFANTIPAI